jgi:hypothetical protein
MRGGRLGAPATGLASAIVARLLLGWGRCAATSLDIGTRQGRIRLLDHQVHTAKRSGTGHISFLFVSKLSSCWLTRATGAQAAVLRTTASCKLCRAVTQLSQRTHTPPLREANCASHNSHGVPC